MPGDLTISTTSDSPEIAQAAANGDEQNARVQAPKFESESQDGSTTVSFEHEHSDRRELLRRMAAAARELEGPDEPSKVVITSNEETQPGEEETSSAVETEGEQQQPESPEPEQPNEQEAPSQQLAASPDFHQRLGLLSAVAPEAVRTLMENADQILIPPKVAQLLGSDRFGADLAVRIASDPTIVEKMLADPEKAFQDAQQMLAVMNFHANNPTSNFSAPAPVTRPRSAAPAPIKPVGGSATKSSLPPEEMSYRDYRRWRDTQQKNRGR